MYLLSFVVMIAAFNIVSGLSMMVKDKASDIAILTTLGLPSNSLMLVFVIQGAVIGLIGIILGLAVGLPMAYFVPEIVNFIEQIVGGRMLAGTYFSEVPSDVRYGDISVVVASIDCDCFVCNTLSCLHRFTVGPCRGSQKGINTRFNALTDIWCDAPSAFA